MTTDGPQAPRLEDMLRWLTPSTDQLKLLQQMMSLVPGALEQRQAFQQMFLRQMLPPEQVRAIQEALRTLTPPAEQLKSLQRDLATQREQLEGMVAQLGAIQRTVDRLTAVSEQVRATQDTFVGILSLMNPGSRPSASPTGAPGTRQRRRPRRRGPGGRGQRGRTRRLSGRRSVGAEQRPQRLGQLGQAGVGPPAGLLVAASGRRQHQPHDLGVHLELGLGAAGAQHQAGAVGQVPDDHVARRAGPRAPSRRSVTSVTAAPARSAGGWRRIRAMSSAMAAWPRGPVGEADRPLGGGVQAVVVGQLGQRVGDRCRRPQAGHQLGHEQARR